MDDLRLIYITCPGPGPGPALALGRVLVEESLAACINVLPGMRSCYRWEGVLEEADEAVLIVKTRAALAEAAVARARALHPAAVPCILVLPVVGGDAAYLAWLRDGTAPTGAPAP
jgi:periplasmic divalent cation tolerance protein